MANSLKVGDRVKFQASCSDGSIARWSAPVVRVSEDGKIVSVRHPEAARTMPFSGCPEKALYRYETAKMVKK